MKYVVSRFNHDISWLGGYTDDVVLYDRSEIPAEGAIVVPNIGSDLFDKFTFIIDNYDNLPEVAVYTKANLWKYITEEEFEEVKDNKTFTPLLTMKHHTYSDEKGVVCFYSKDGMYNERNDYFYLKPHPAKYAKEIIDIFGMDKRQYNAFAPGSGYILTKQDILRHSRQGYVKLRSFLDWDVYPGDAQLLERNLYYLWGTDIITL